MTHVVSAGSSSARKQFVWGWLRLFLGFCQTVLSLAGAVLLVTLGPSPVTWIVVTLALLALLASILLYGFRSKPPRSE